MRLKNTRAYLAGPVERSHDCKSWRDIITKELLKLEIIPWSPLIKPKWFIEECGCELSAEQQRDDKKELNYLAQGFTINDENVLHRNQYVRKVCLRLVSACDWVICKVDGPTVGTFEEITIAGQQGKPVLFFGNDQNLDSCWRAVQFINNNEDQIWFRNINDIVEYITSIHEGSTQVDKLSWIFMNEQGWNE
jgi:hypothetical protein